MPVVGLLCKTHAEEVQPDHFGLGKCMYVPKAMATDVMEKDKDRPNGWSVTNLLGSVREVAILRFLDVVVDPLHWFKMQKGTAIHQWLEKRDGYQPRFFGEISGLQISGVPDLISSAPTRIGDYKSGRPPHTMAYKENIVQVSLYAELIRQSPLKWNLGMYDIIYLGGNQPVTHSGPLMTLTECLDYEVATDVTVANNIEMCKEIDKLIASGLHPKDAILAGTFDRPCVCARIKYGKYTKAERYCPVKDVMCGGE